MEGMDRELVCAQCGAAFGFSAGEQEFFRQRGLEDPRRCKPCRANKRPLGARGPGVGAGAGDARPQGGYGGPPRGPGGHAPGGGGFQSRGRQQPWRPASPDDPNGYRSPGFQDSTQNPYQIDYAGLPRDDEDEGASPGNSAGPVSRSEPLTSHLQGNRWGQQPRGMNGRRPDRAGTDPNAYRSPGFPGAAQGNRGPVGDRPRGGYAPRPLGADTAPRPNGADEAPPADGERRGRRRERPRFETSCQACGAAAVVPFEPGPDRPAFCKPCYESKKVELGLGPGRTLKRPALTATPAPAPAPAAPELADSTPPVTDTPAE